MRLNTLSFAQAGIPVWAGKPEASPAGKGELPSEVIEAIRKAEGAPPCPGLPPQWTSVVAPPTPVSPLWAPPDGVVLHWSWWRRRHQQRAKRCHYQKRLAQLGTEARLYYVSGPVMLAHGRVHF
jgi:hypothetical protein